MLGKVPVMLLLTAFKYLSCNTTRKVNGVSTELQTCFVEGSSSEALATHGANYC